ncbi:MAG: ATP-dependent Clp protease adaptor ClpS [Bacteroidales bacterium]|nr:ATP-dependent Clp protease adaptor ClpS [Bacteroidales bacterium]
MHHNLPNNENREGKEKVTSNILVLHNDDSNTFEYIIQSLIEICNHDPYQANQCALIAHYKGKCEIKTGNYEVLKNMRKEFSKRGIKTSIH